MSQVLTLRISDEMVIHLKCLVCGLGIGVVMYGFQNFAVLGLGSGLGIPAWVLSSVLVLEVKVNE